MTKWCLANYLEFPRPHFLQPDKTCGGKDDTVFLMTEYRTLYFGSRVPIWPDKLLHLHTNELTNENHIFGVNSGRLKRFVWVWVAHLGLDIVPREAFAR